MESKFKEGDLVQLNSGGPTMTVVSSEKLKDLSKDLEWYSITCTWFNDKEQEYENGNFNEGVLSHYLNPLAYL